MPGKVSQYEQAVSIQQILSQEDYPLSRTFISAVLSEICRGRFGREVGATAPPFMIKTQLGAYLFGEKCAPLCDPMALLSKLFDLNVRQCRHTDQDVI